MTENFEKTITENLKLVIKPYIEMIELLQDKIKQLEVQVWELKNNK